MQKHKYFISDIAATTDPTQAIFFPRKISSWIGGGRFLMLFLSARPRKQHLIICSNAEVHNHSRRRDGITLFTCVCFYWSVCVLLKRAIGLPPPTYPPSQLLPANTSQYLVKVFIKCAVMGWRLPPPQLSCSLDITCAPTSLWSPLLLHYGYSGTKIPLSWLHLWMWKTYAVVSHPVLWKPKITTSNEKKEVNLGSFCSSLPGILYLLQESTALEHSALTSILGEENRKNPELPSDEK